MILAAARALSHFGRRSEGTAALEFAFVASTLVLLVVGTMEVSRIMFAISLLEGGLREAARFGITGQEQNQAARKQRIVDIILEHGAGVVKIDATNVQTQVYENFSAIGKPEDFVDTFIPLNNAYDVGEPYTDVNCNGQWDADQGRAGLGGGGEVVLYNVDYDLPLMTGLLAPLIGSAGTFRLGASVAVRNEPFFGGDPGCT
jgi:hypothetical protein